MINCYDALSDQALIIHFDYLIKVNEHLLFKMKKIQSILLSFDRIEEKFKNPCDNFLHSERVIWSDEMRKCCERFVVLDIDSNNIVNIIFKRLENRN
jgi:hypothetical protein